MNTIRDFDVVLRDLEQARADDEDVHRSGGSLADRVASRERLETLRAEMATIRASLGIQPNKLTGAHDSRSRRGTGNH